MSQPPDYPGKKRFVRMTARTGGGAYEGAAEAVGAILVATLLGYGIDLHFETSPIALVIGAGIGFAAFVVRLMRLGRQLHGDEMTYGSGVNKKGSSDKSSKGAGNAIGASGTVTETNPPNKIAADAENDRSGPAEELGLSNIFDDNDEDRR